MIAPTLLVVCLATGSAGVGYAAAARSFLHMPDIPVASSEPRLGAAVEGARNPKTLQQWLLASELGKLQAEVVRLRVLFLRLAELAQLEGGEFDLDMDFVPSEEDFDDRQSFNHLGVGELMPSGWSRKFAYSDEQPVTESLTLVKQALGHISDQSGKLQSMFRERRLANDFRVSGSPVESIHVSSRFGYRLDPITGRRHIHRGLDLRGKPGTKVLALADGIVTYSGVNGGYGNLVELEHPDGYRTRYAHNQSLLVPLGGRVSKGQPIATMGSTGRSTGTHVHVEVRHNGRAVDPQLYIR